MIRLIGKIRFVTRPPAVPLAALMAPVRTLAPRLSTVDSSDTTGELRRARLPEEGFTRSGCWARTCQLQQPAWNQR